LDIGNSKHNDREACLITAFLVVFGNGIVIGLKKQARSVRLFRRSYDCQIVLGQVHLFYIAQHLCIKLKSFQRVVYMYAC